MMLRQIWSHSSFPAGVLAALALIFALSVNPGLLTTGSMIGWSTSQLGLWTAVLGQTLALMGRGIDLSIGSAVSLVNVSAIALFEAGWPLTAVVPATLVLGLAIGALNGALVGGLRLNPLLATFATSFVLLGLALQIRPAPGGMAPMPAVMFLNGASWGIPNAMLLFVLVLLLWALIAASLFWIRLRAVGTDPVRAWNSGLPVQWLKFGSYTLAGLFTGLSGLFVTLCVGAGDPLFAQPYTLLTIAGAVIGGVALNGGSGSGYGAVLGAVFVGLTSDIALGIGISPFFQQLIVGCVLLVGLAIVVLSGRWLQQKSNAALIHASARRGERA
ncbi:ABC transporter permease [Paenirhodobacter populi]|uniref:Autoinducer 2 import system permease protein LsrD n=1 Tax=Paenirhodobacter populi TaxID=2306993 RepID=A0A443J4B6_9RHOB|nr:ABC transporter permease [Sinirhodobacter populi]RWR15314.1 ABC transporter permease [Sinirhodobacter populi]